MDRVARRWGSRHVGEQVTHVGNRLDEVTWGMQVLKDVGAKYKDRPFSYLWVEGGKQVPLEKALEVGG